MGSGRARRRGWDRREFSGACRRHRRSRRGDRQGGKLILVGIGGGTFSLSAGAMVFAARAIDGSFTGTIAELREVLQLAKEQRLLPIPFREVVKERVNEVMAELEQGTIVGRVVLADAAACEN